MNTIICPVDFLKCSKNAAMYAAQLSKEFNSRLILMHVYECSNGNIKPESLKDDKNIIDLNSILYEKLYKLKGRLESEYNLSRVNCFVEAGTPSKQICLLASQEAADTIVLGTAGLRNKNGDIFGSTAAQVISMSDIPVICVPTGGLYHGLHQIVFATDLEADNLNSAIHIVSFAKHFNAEIKFIYINSKDAGHSEELASEMTKKIRGKIKYSKMSGFVVNEKSVSEGIGYFIKSNFIDLLAMFTHESKLLETVSKKSNTIDVLMQTRVPLLSLPLNTNVIASKF